MTMAKYTIFNMRFTPKLPTIRGMWFVLYRDKPKEDFRMIYIARSREEAREFIRWCKNNSFEGKNPILQFFRETNSLYDNLKEILKRDVLDCADPKNSILVMLECERCGSSPSMIYTTPAGVLCQRCYGKIQKLN